MSILWASKSTFLNLGVESIFHNECTERFVIFIILYNSRCRYLVSTESPFKELSYFLCVTAVNCSAEFIRALKVVNRIKANEIKIF